MSSLTLGHSFAAYGQSAPEDQLEEDQSESPFESPDEKPSAPNEIDPDNLPPLPALPPQISPENGPSEEFLELFPDVFPELSPQDESALDGPEGESEDGTEQAGADELTQDEATPEARPDIIIHSARDRQEQLDRLFEELVKIDDADKANLVAEEIWAIWLQSGSASVDYLLLRGTDAQTRGDHTLAQRMFEHVIRLAPDYAEGYTRAGRLALEQEKLGQAMADITKSLILEPRQFYSLWTLGNIFERLGRNDEAFEVYSEALRLYPALETVKDRVEFLSQDVEGESL